MTDLHYRKPTITRRQLARAAQDAIDRAAYLTERRGEEPDPQLHGEIMEIARTVEKVAGYWWLPDAECGCLVGTLLKRRGENPETVPPVGEPHDIGITFLSALDDAVGARVHLTHVMTVVD